MQEMGTYIQQDVKGKLVVTCEMFMVDIGSLMSYFQDKQQVSDRDLRNGANAADGRLIENNERNNQQENLLSQLSEAIIGLREEMIVSRNNTQQIHEKQMKIEQKIEEERVRVSEEIKKRIDSVQTQEDRQRGWIMYEQTKVLQSDNVGVKSEVTVEVPPPGLTFGEVGQRYFNQSPRNLPTQKNHWGGDTDSIMTDVNTTQDQKQRNQQTPLVKEEAISNVAQQLPNTDPISTETNDWANQDWDAVDWGSFNYYNWAIPMGCWGNNPETQEKGKAKGGNIQRGVQIHIPLEQIRRGGIF